MLAVAAVPHMMAQLLERAALAVVEIQQDQQALVNLEMVSPVSLTREVAAELRKLYQLHRVMLMAATAVQELLLSDTQHNQTRGQHEIS